MIFNNYGKQSKGKYANINKNNTVSIGKNINTKQNTVKSTPLPAGSVRHPTLPWPSRNSKMTRTVPSAANKSSPVDASKNRERAGKGLSSEINLPEETRLSTNINKEKTGNNKFGNLAEAISIIGKPAENKITNTMSNTKEKKNGLLEGVLEKGKEGVDWLKGKGEKVKEGGQELFANI